MPIVTIAIYSGRTQTEKDRLAEAISEDVAKILKVPKKKKSLLYSRKRRTATGLRQASDYSSLG
jgi:4-oxalocrotonate tautomerase